MRAVNAWGARHAAELAHLVRAEVTNEGLAQSNELLRALIDLLEVVGRVAEVDPPVEPQPLHVLLDRADKDLLLGRWVRVVEAQKARPVEVAAQPKVEADALGVANVQKAVWFGREPGLHATSPFSVLSILLDDLTNEVALLHHLAGHDAGCTRGLTRRQDSP